MIVHRLQRFARAGHDFNDVSAVAHSEFHLLDVTPLQFILFRTDVFTRDAFTAQGFFDDLLIRHAGHHHFAERTRCAENRFEHRNGVVLENAVPLSPDKRAVEVPKQNAEIREFIH